MTEYNIYIFSIEKSNDLTIGDFYNSTQNVMKVDHTNIDQLKLLLKKLGTEKVWAPRSISNTDNFVREPVI